MAWEVELAYVRPLPARRTIERLLQRGGRTARRRSAPPPRPEAAYPAVAARAPGDVHQTDLVGPGHLRTPRGPVRLALFLGVEVHFTRRGEPPLTGRSILRASL